MRPRRHPETIAAQAGGAIDENTGAFVAPLHLAVSYVRDPSKPNCANYRYGRSENATVRQAEQVLNELEGGAASLLFSSGMSAATTTLLSLERPAHVVVGSNVYQGLRNWLVEEAPRHGIAYSFADSTVPSAIAAAIRPRKTRLIWIETPSNPHWHVSDIAALAEIAARGGVLLAVDSTVATPVLTKPLSLGADLVLHSATKYLNGHSDIVAGAAVFAARTALFDTAAKLRDTLGGAPSPFDAALLTRGLKTLFVRVRQQCLSAATIAEFCSQHPLIATTLYPGLACHPGHSIAKRQMAGGFGGVVSIRLTGGCRAAIATATAVQVWRHATSLGGVESLIEHRTYEEGPSNRERGNLLRLSVGLENVDELIGDLDSAVRSAQQ